MTNTVLIKRSATANAVPTGGQLANGEIAINYADGNLFYKDSGGSVQTLASKKFVSVTGNITGGNVDTGIVSATGNVVAGNLNAAGLSLSSNVVSALVSAANITTTANIAANYYIGNGSLLTGIAGGGNYSNSNVATFLADFGSNVISTSGNVTAGNLTVNGNITYVNSNVVTINDKFINVANNAATSGAANGGGLGVGPVDAEYATLTFNNGTTAWNTNISLSVNGNVSGNYFVGNGSALTSISGASVIGTVANATYAVSAGSAGSAVTAEQVTFAVQANITGVGTLGNLSVSGNTTVGNLSTGGFVSATGNVTGGNLITSAAISAASVSASGNILTAGLISATGNITSDGSIITGGVGTGNITGANLISAVSMSLTGQSRAASYITAGNITGANLTVAAGTVTVGNIVNGNGNGVGNIGSSTGYFNTVFAQSTTAIYADLAEYYAADVDYPPGTVLSFGGAQEVTMSIGINDARVAGIVSTQPAHVMNAGLTGQNAVAVALIGRVPTMVIGTVAPGDMMVTAGGGRAKACATPAMGTVIGKAVQAHPGGQGTIEIVVGRL